VLSVDVVEGPALSVVEGRLRSIVTAVDPSLRLYDLLALDQVRSAE
jgi:hypothetical protein